MPLKYLNNPKGKDFFDTITNEDIKTLGLFVLLREEDEYCKYILISDKERYFDDKKYACHYEILQMVVNDELLRHEKDKIYVEIHFEHKTNSKCFIPTISALLSNNKNLESFNWRKYCPGLRLKDNGFFIHEKDKILQNLKELKDLTLECLLETYRDYNNSNNWISSFELGCGNRQTSNTRNLPEIIREAGEIKIVHEAIKTKLIERIKENPCFIDNNIPLKIETLSSENPVNKINYIDLAAEFENGDVVFFEIKTAVDARICIRQALGQLMEYAYFPNVCHAKKLVVVGTGEKSNKITQYISLLNDTFQIDIDYKQIQL